MTTTFTEQICAHDQSTDDHSVRHNIVEIMKLRLFDADVPCANDGSFGNSFRR